MHLFILGGLLFLFLFFGGFLETFIYSGGLLKQASG